MDDDEDSLAVQRAQFLIDQLGPEKAIEHLGRMYGYKTIPVPINQFIDDPYFLGHSVGWNCSNGQWGTGVYQGFGIYPTWRKILNEIYIHPLFVPKREVILTGAIGLGKTTCAAVGVLYDTYRLLCLENPRGMFMLNDSDPLVIAFINKTLDLAKETAYAKFLNFLKKSPYFETQMRGADKGYLLPQDIKAVTGSRAGDVLGKGVFTTVLSEMDFQGEHYKNQADENYNQIFTRMESRFARGSQYMMPGRLWVDTSRKEETSFLSTHLKNLDKNKAVVYSFPIWQIQKEIGKVDFSGKTFKVFVGAEENRDPKILSDTDDLSEISSNELIEVPVELEDIFRRNLFIGLRDYAGVALFTMHSAIPSKEMIKQSLINPSPLRPHVSEILQLGIRTNERIVDFIDLSVIPTHDENGKVLNYFIHFDISKSGSLDADRTGVALTCCRGQVQVNRVDSYLIGKVQRDRFFDTPLVLSLAAKPGSRIPQTKLRDLITDLIHAGIRIVGVSADQFQSEAVLTFAEENFIENELISLDRKKDPYDMFIDALLEGRWTGPNLKLLKKELEELKDEGDKYNHPSNERLKLLDDKFSKDMADGIAGSLWHCATKTPHVNIAPKLFLENIRQRRSGLSLEDRLRIEVDNKSKLPEIQEQVFGNVIRPDSVFVSLAKNAIERSEQQKLQPQEIDDVLAAVFNPAQLREYNKNKRMVDKQEAKEAKRQASLSPEQKLAEQIKKQVSNWQKKFKNMY